MGVEALMEGPIDGKFKLVYIPLPQTFKGV